MNHTTYILPPGTTSVHRTPATLVKFCNYNIGANKRRKAELHRIHEDGKETWEVWSDRPPMGVISGSYLQAFDDEDEARRDFHSEMLYATNGFGK